MIKYSKNVDSWKTPGYEPDAYMEKETHFTPPEISKEEEGDVSSVATLQLQKMTYAKGRLENYGVSSNKYFQDTEIDYGQEIKSIVDKVLILLQSIKEENPDSADTEAVLSNILEYNNKLWKLRVGREKAFSEVLVLLKSCLKYYDSTQLDTKKVTVLEKIYRELSSSLLSTFPKECRKWLQAAGLNIFRPLIVAKVKLKI